MSKQDVIILTKFSMHILSAWYAKWKRKSWVKKLSKKIFDSFIKSWTWLDIQEGDKCR